jgi:hypothetical protein
VLIVPCRAVPYGTFRRYGRGTTKIDRERKFHGAQQEVGIGRPLLGNMCHPALDFVSDAARNTHTPKKEEPGDVRASGPPISGVPVLMVWEQRKPTMGCRRFIAEERIANDNRHCAMFRALDEMSVKNPPVSIHAVSKVRKRSTIIILLLRYYN